MRWWGLYTQRRQGIPGGKTAIAAARGARCGVLHAARAQRRRRAEQRPGPGHRRHLERVRPRDRRHLRPAEHPAALDPDRGRARDLAAPGGGRARHHRGVRRHAPGRPRLTGGRRRRRRDHRRHPRDRRDPAPLHRRPRLGEPAAQVQERGIRLAAAGRRPRDQRHLLHRGGASGARPRLRRVGRRRAVHGAEAGHPAGRLGAAGRGRGCLVRRHPAVPRLRLPAAAHQGADQVPDRGLGRGEVPHGARRGVPRPAAASTAPRRPRLPPTPATTWASTRSATAASTWAPPRPSGGSPGRNWPGSPIWPRSTAAGGSGSRRIRSS